MLPRARSHAAVCLKSVSKQYGSTIALKNVSCDFQAGTWYALTGPSGSGKSTLLTCSAGLSRPSTGTVHVAGINISRASDRKLTRIRRDHIGFVFQHFNLIPSLSALENVTLPLRLAGRKIRDADARELLHGLGLGNHVSHLPSELSGGQQQRVAIARAVVHQPSVVFADEPTGALDPQARDVVMEALRSLTDRGVCLVMVTHDMNLAAKADVHLRLDGGEIVSMNAADQVAGPSHCAEAR